MDNAATYTILIADDDPFIIKAYKAGFERYDYNVVVAIDGEEAFEQITELVPDLILLDVIMPKKDGFEVLKAVKANPALAHIPIVMLTSLAQLSDEQAARQYGAVDFLVKSDVSLNEILTRVQKLLEESTEAASLAVEGLRAPSSVPDLPSSPQFAAEAVEAEEPDSPNDADPQNQPPNPKTI